MNYPLWIKISVSFFLCMSLHSTYGSRTYTKDWSVANIIGPIAKDSSFKYYLEPQLRLVDTSAVFNQFLLLAGLGYQFNSKLMFFIGPGWIPIKTMDGTTYIEKRLWQQLNWQVIKDTSLSLNSRTRLEERQHSNQAQVAVRFRERLWLRVPFKTWPSYSFSCFDEFFFNFNHPRWTSPYFFEQNRAFFGIAKQLSTSAVLDFGYLNQFIHSTNSMNDNVILLSFTLIH